VFTEYIFILITKLFRRVRTFINNSTHKHRTLTMMNNSDKTYRLTTNEKQRHYIQAKS